jgi:hypothetical protein
MTSHLSWLLQITDKVVNPFGYARQAFNTASAYHEGFFIPHDNETGYWWQGENARLGSLASASVYASRKLWYSVPDSVSHYAVNQLDWILGRNPYGICFMNGKGTTNPEAYTGSNTHAGNLAGGISNGITGNNTDGSGITWQTAETFGIGSGNEWESWRWIEQWIPHATWYLMSLAVLEDENPPQAPVTAIQSNPTRITANDLHVQRHGDLLSLSFTNPVNQAMPVRIVELQGRMLAQTQMAQGAQSLQLQLPASAQGLLIVQAGHSVQRITP